MASTADLAGADVGLLSPVTVGTAAERLTGDQALLAAMVRAETALLRALVDEGVAPATASTLADDLDCVRLDPREIALAAPVGGNPVIPLVKALRSAAPEDLAPWVHFGATSQDIVDTAMMLVATDVCRVIGADLRELAFELASLTERHRDTPAIARTLTQQALPTTLGFRLAGWLLGVVDAFLAVTACTPLPASLGGPVGTVEAYGVRGPGVLEAFATRLGLSAPPLSWHVRRTPQLHLHDAMQQTGAACGKVAADVLAMAQTEVGEVAEATGGPSSSMAHKANPVRSVLIASAVPRIRAAGAAVLSCDAPENERPAGAWHAEWQPLRELMRLSGATAEATGRLVAGLRFDEAAMGRHVAELAARLNGSPGDAATQSPDNGVWVDRALARYREVLS